MCFEWKFVILPRNVSYGSDTMFGEQLRMTFAIIASAIISGSLVERMRFSAYAVLLTLWRHGLFCVLGMS